MRCRDHWTERRCLAGHGTLSAACKRMFGHVACGPAETAWHDGIANLVGPNEFGSLGRVCFLGFGRVHLHKMDIIIIAVVMQYG